MRTIHRAASVTLALLAGCGSFYAPKACEERLDNLGGVDLDAALLEFVATVHRGQNPDAWQRLEDPQTPADRRHRRHLIEDVRAAKEMLSRAASAMVPVPLLEMEARVSREEFDALARPLLE